MEDRNRHFVLHGVTETESFRSRGYRPQPSIPERNRIRHSAGLQSQLEEVKATAESARNAQRAVEMSEGLGLRLEFESFPGIELAFESLAFERSGIELLNVRHDDTDGDNVVTRATVFVPDGKLRRFEGFIRDYLEEKRDARGRARDRRPLIDAIQQIRAASLRALWTDTDGFPSADEGPIWWEVWLPVRDNRQAVISAFRDRVNAIAEGVTSSRDVSRGFQVRGGDQRMRVSPGELHFPERTVLLAYASVEQMEQSMLVLNSISELRRALETAEFFDSLLPNEQIDWLDNLLARMHYPNEGDDVPHVCLFDTGVNRGHRLITPALAAADLHTVGHQWGTADDQGHGTNMAGLALAGNLTELLASNDAIRLLHRLESVKVLQSDGTNGEDPKHHGHLTVEAVSRPEITAPNRSRVFAMAVTSRNNRDRGRPSAWSATLDALAADTSDQGANPRLFVLSAGNVCDEYSWLQYPDSNDTDGIHDPAQAWNALTIGACTDLVQITEPDALNHLPIAPVGALSPFSTTSLTWQQRWPLKPDVVLEGGNVAKSPSRAIIMDSLSLLTSHHKPNDRLFVTTNATSAATALASRLAAQVMAMYPELWPETVRALIVHSAEWTDAMIRSSLPTHGNASKADYLRLIQRCGFGVPDINRALWSVTNSLTMVIEESIHPFRRSGSQQPVLRDMHLHNLPWPHDVLTDLGETPVEMRVTLSYFIEPNPSHRGIRSRYRYESHGLRFDVKRPHETVNDFRSRINIAARDEETGTQQRDTDPSWLVGKQQRHRGSLHGDIWRGSAADLASRGNIAVYPTSGWWKTRPALKKYDQLARYALVVSIRAPETKVDLYTEVANRIVTAVDVET